MRIAVGSDHAGYALKSTIVDHLTAGGHDVVDLGAESAEVSVDYPMYGHAVGEAVAEGRAERGVCVCGSGIGMSIAANKVRGVRAALVHDELTAEMSRSHNDANVVCMSADLLGQKLIEKIVEIWLTTPFQGGRHERRVKKIHAIENGVDPATM